MKRTLFITTFLLAGMLILPAAVFSQESEKKEKKELEQQYADRRLQMKEQEKQLELEMKHRQEAERKSREYEFFYGRNNSASTSYRRGSGVNNSFTITNTLKDNTRKKEYRFTVDTACVNINISVTVTCQEGDIVVTLYTPDGKKFNSLDFSEGESSAWRQSIQINNASEKEKKKYTGEWIFKVQTSHATGKYHITIISS